MNIVEAYIKFSGQLIILISGLSGSGKCKLAKNIQNDFNNKKMTKDFNCKLINLDDYCLKENHKNVTLNVDDISIQVKDWDHIDVYDWNKFNDSVNKVKDSGVIICGTYFPTNKLNFSVDVHLHVKISKQKLIENRLSYIKKHLNDCPELEKIDDQKIITLIINKITYPHYLEYLGISKIDKFLNATELDTETIINESFKYLMFYIQKYLNDLNKTKEATTSISETIKNERIKSSLDETYDDIYKDAIYMGSTIEED